MSERRYIPVKAGKSGTKRHWGYFGHYDSYGRRDVYETLCTVVNTHRINHHPTVRPLPEGTEVNCVKCLAEMAKKVTA